MPPVIMPAYSETEAATASRSRETGRCLSSLRSSQIDDVPRATVIGNPLAVGAQAVPGAMCIFDFKRGCGGVAGGLDQPLRRAASERLKHRHREIRDHGGGPSDRPRSAFYRIKFTYARAGQTTCAISHTTDCLRLLGEATAGESTVGGYRAQRMDLRLNLSQFAGDEFYGCWPRGCAVIGIDTGSPFDHGTETKLGDPQRGPSVAGRLAVPPEFLQCVKRFPSLLREVIVAEPSALTVWAALLNHGWLAAD